MLIQRYNTAVSFLNHKLDIKYYLNIIQQVNKIKYYLFNYYQNKSLENLRKVNLLDAKDIERNDIELDSLKTKLDIVEYYSDRIRNQTMDEADNVLINEIDINMLNLIHEKTKNTKK